MLTIKLGTFSKRENSTKIFSGTWTNYNCALKDDCTIISPVIELHTTTNLNGYNYAYIPDFNRYYFISNIEYYREVVRLHLTVDTLASYKTAIGSSSEYILRSASDYNGDIVDNLYPCKADTYIKTVSSESVFDTNDICYIIGILNNSTTNKYGAVKYYVIDSTDLGGLMGFLLGNDIITASENLMDNIAQTISTYVTEIQNGVVRSLMNPCDYIVESYALPYTPAVGAKETLKIGWWITPYFGYPVLRDNDFTQTIAEGYLSLGRHNDAATRGDYLNCAPFTRMWLYAGIFGIVPIDTMKVINTDAIYYKVYGDIFGNIKCDIRTTESTGGGLHVPRALIDTLSANVKCNFPIGQVSIDALGGASATLAAATGAMVGGDADNAADAQVTSLITGVQGIGNAVKAMIPQSRVSGSTGTFCGVFRDFVSYSEHHPQVDEDVTHRGKPLCEVRQINTLSGYILCCDADLAIAGTKEENKIIKNYMNSGFYYE